MVVVARQEALRRGLSRYFTGEACKRGHIAERFVGTRRCCECEKIRHKAYHAKKMADPAWRAAEAQRALKWNKLNPERHKANKIKSRLKTIDKVKTDLKRWQAANRDKLREDMRRWQQANPDKMREYDRRRREKNPEKAAARLEALTAKQAYKDASRTNRRSRVRGNRGTVTGAALQSVKDRARGRCANCGKRRKLEYDHIVPLARGGRHDAKNLQMLCRPCNVEKHARDPIEWAQDNGRLL